MAQKAYIDIIDVDNQTLLDSKRNDIAFYTIFGDNKILISAGSNVNSKLCITSNNIGIGTVNPRVKLDINSTDALQIPVGTVADRDNFSANWNNGQIRYNTVSQQYEGYGNNIWMTFGSISGVTDTNNDTYISAENGPGTNNDELRFFTSNIEKMRITKNGNIGIGTANPGEFLHIYGSNPMIRIQDTIQSNISASVDFYNSNNLNGYLGFWGSQDLSLNNSTSNGFLRLYTSNTERLTINSNGNIGIGIINPVNKLQVIGDGQFTSNLTVGGITTLNSNLFISGSNTLTTGTGNINILGTTIFNSNLIISGSNTLTTGVGIVNISGITLHNSNVVISGSNTLTTGVGIVNISGVTLHNSNVVISGSNILNFTNSNISCTIGLSNQDLRINNNTSNGLLRLFTSNSERLTVNSNGFIGIGNNNPNAKLEINHNTTSPGLLITNGDGNTLFTNMTQIAFSYAGTNQYNHFIHTRHFGANATNAIDFYVCNGTANNTLTSGSTHVMSMNAGNVGIGTVNPGYPLDVVGSGNFSGSIFNASRPFCVLRDTAQTSGGNYSYTTGLVVQNAGGMYNPSFPTRIYFPVNGYYTVAFTGHATPLAATTNMNLKANITLSANFYGYPTMCIGISIESNGGNGDQLVHGRWSGYQTAGAYCTISCTCSQTVQYNFGGVVNHVSACLDHYL